MVVVVVVVVVDERYVEDLIDVPSDVVKVLERAGSIVVDGRRVVDRLLTHFGVGILAQQSTG